MLSEAAAVTWVVTGDNAEVWYTQEGTGSFSYTVDAGSPTTVSVFGAGPSQPGQKAAFSLGSAGSHTIVVTWVSGYVYLEGVYVYDGDATNGIHFYDASHSQIGSDFYTSATQDPGGLSEVVGVAPHLVILELAGLNDFVDGTYTPTQTLANVNGTIATLNTITNQPSIILLIPYAPNASWGNPNTLGYQWSDYVNQLVTISGPNITTVNLYSLWGQADETGDGLWDSDGLNPSDLGHATIAGLLLGLLDGTPLTALGTGTAFQPNITTGGSTSIVAGVALGTGVAFGPNQGTNVVPGVALGTGSAFQPTSSGIAAVTSVTPAVGPVQSSTAVTILGNNFADVVAVMFGEIPAVSFVVESSTEITATAPIPPTPGTVAVSVST